jgi:hypothetical protein
MPKGHHQHGTDDRHAGPVDSHAGQLAECEDQITDSEDDGCRGNL